MNSYGGVKNLLVEDNKQCDTEFVSLGDHCIVALYLKKFGYKTCSYPFDWLVSNVDMITHILKDNFLTFLNHPNKYKLKSGEVFVHHTMTKDREYYKRCIERFRGLKTRKVVFFLAVCECGGDNRTRLAVNHRKYTEDDFIMLLDVLCTKYQIANSRLVIINLLPTPPDTYHTQINSNIDIFRYNAEPKAALVNKKIEHDFAKLFASFNYSD